jgi:MFS family permease
VNGAVGTVTTGWAARGLAGEWSAGAGARFDGTGAALYAAALAACAVGLGLLPSPSGAVPLLAGVAGLAAFVRRELRTADPVLDMALFRDNRVFAYSNLAALVAYAATFAVSFLFSLYLQDVRALGPRAAGAVLAVQPLVQAAVSPFAGRLSDRMDARAVASGGMGAIAAGLVLLALVGEDTPLVWVGGGLAVLGAGIGLFSSPNTHAVMASLDARDYGVGSAAVGTMRLLGQMSSMGLTGMILGLFSPRGFLAASRAALVLFGLLSVAGTLASLARGRTGTAEAPGGPARRR